MPAANAASAPVFGAISTRGAILTGRANASWRASAGLKRQRRGNESKEEEKGSGEHKATIMSPPRGERKNRQIPPPARSGNASQECPCEASEVIAPPKASLWQIFSWSLFLPHVNYRIAPFCASRGNVWLYLYFIGSAPRALPNHYSGRAKTLIRFLNLSFSYPFITSERSSLICLGDLKSVL